MKKVIMIICLLIFSAGIFGQTLSTISSSNKQIPDCNSLIKKAIDSTCVAMKDSIAKLHASIKVEKIKAMKNDIYGGVDPVHYVAAFIFCLMAMFIRWSFVINKGVRTNPDTPNKFIWSIFFISILKKTIRVFAGLCLIFCFLRFSNEVLGFAFSMFLAFCIGIFFDFLADKLMSIDPKVIFNKNAIINQNQ